MLARTSSHTCGRWYLPTFLFRDGSLTLMYIASLIALIWFKSSHPTILKLLMETLWPLMLLWSYMGEGGFRCSLNLSPNVLEDSPMYSSSQSTLSQWYPLSPIVANIYMENFEVEAITSAPNPPQFWKRYVDDTFIILQSSTKDEFLEHLNSIDQQIQFTAENQREDEAMPFLDILVSPARDGSLSTSVYRKPTHTDLYLQWGSHHPLSSKYSVIGTLQQRAHTISSNTQLLQKEEEHLHQALKKCQYPTWTLNK